MVMTERRTGGARWTSTLFILFAAALAALLGHTDLVASASSNAALPTFSTPCFTPAAIHNGLPPQETSSYTVPATGVSKVRAVLRGQNGGGSYTSGGLGSTLVVEVPVTPGQVLHAGGLAGAPGGTGGGTVKVGSGTYTGYPGGNGGDAQYLSTAGSDGCRHALAVAGGGGGGGRGTKGGNADAGTGATGGANGGFNLETDGGGGGGAQATIGGTPGKGGYTSNFFMDCNDGNNGRWGEFLTGGNGGNAPAMKSLSTCDYPAHGGGGGGGSSYIDPSATKISLSAAANTGGDPVIVPVYSTTTTLSASPEFSPYGATVTLTAHVTSASPTQPVAGGTVEFFDRIVPPDGRGLIAISIGTAQVASTGDATLATASLSAGLHNLQACFLGTANTTAAYRGSCGSYQHGVSGPEQCAPAPSFTDQPTDATVAYGEYASFNATMSSLPEYIEWQVSSDGGTTWTNVPLYANLQRDTPTPGSHYTFINFIPPVSQSGLKYHAVATTCGGTTASNTATLTVNPPPIVANDKTMVVGGPVPSLDATTYDGVVLHNGDTPSGMSGRLSCTTPPILPRAPYAYPITCSGLSSPNYTVSYRQGTLIVDVGAITFDLSTLPAKTYGDAAFDISSYASASSGLPVSFSSATSSVCTVAGNMVTVLAAGTCTINADQAGTSDISPASQVQQSITVNKKTLTVVAGTPPSQPQGTASAPTVTCTAGFVGSDGFVTKPSGAVYARILLSDGSTMYRKITVSANTPAGNYLTRCAGGDPGSNYTIGGYKDGKFTIGPPLPPALTISANNKSYPYGATPPTLDVAYSSGNGSGLVGTLSCRAYAKSDTGYASPIALSGTTPVVAGGYAIHCTGLSSSSYTITWADGALTVNPAPVAVTASSPPTQTHGATFAPSITCSATGFVGADSFIANPTGAVYDSSGTDQVSIDSTADAGSYTTKCSDGDPGSNYTISGYTPAPSPSRTPPPRS